MPRLRRVAKTPLIRRPGQDLPQRDFTPVFFRTDGMMEILTDALGHKHCWKFDSVSPPRPESDRPGRIQVRVRGLELDCDY